MLIHTIIYHIIHMYIYIYVLLYVMIQALGHRLQQKLLDAGPPSAGDAGAGDVHEARDGPLQAQVAEAQRRLRLCKQNTCIMSCML